MQSHVRTLLKPTFTFGERTSRRILAGSVLAQTILIVDDDPVQRRLLEGAITRAGMNVVTAPGGQPALDLIDGPRGEQIC